MKLGIIGAMPQEVAELAALLENPSQRTIAGCTLYEGRIQGVDIALLQSGIGKVAAAMGTTLLLELCKPDYVVNTGSAGGVGTGLNMGDVVVSNETLHHDADVTAFGYAQGQLPNNPPRFASNAELIERVANTAKAQGLAYHFGLIASGDCFVNGGEALARIKQHFPDVQAVEMEAAAIAQVCHAFNVPFVVIRAISDSGDGSANISFDEFLPLAAKQSTQMVLALIQQFTQA